MNDVTACEPSERSKQGFLARFARPVGVFYTRPQLSLGLADRTHGFPARKSAKLLRRGTADAE